MPTNGQNDKTSNFAETKSRPRGDLVFSALLFLFALFLISQLETEAKWIENLPLLKQPRFWPVLTLGGFLIFATGNLIQSILDARRNKRRHYGYQYLPWDELLTWVKPLEFASYFLLYVFAIPLIGYLLSTLLFCPLLTLRMGFKTKKFIIISLLAGLIIVVVFRTILSVKLPAGEIYNLFPDQIRNFLMLYC